MKRSVVDVAYLAEKSALFRGRCGSWLAKLVLHLLAIDRVNWVYNRSCDYTGAAFANGLLKDLGVDYRVGNADRLQHLPEGAFITVSNHPYGGLDGIMLIHLMAGIRPDYKVMVNQILSLIEAMDENFISVQPRIGNDTSLSATAISGVRETLLHLKDGHPVGFFPAGAVSMFKFNDLRVHDREWQEGILKLISLANVPVLPIRFFDFNSIFFYFLGVISWRIRMLRMPYEVFNKKGKRPRIGIGEIISAEKIQSFSDIKELGKFLRKTTCEMPVPDSFIEKADLPNKDMKSVD